MFSASWSSTIHNWPTEIESTLDRTTRERERERSTWLTSHLQSKRKTPTLSRKECALVFQLHWTHLTKTTRLRRKDVTAILYGTIQWTETKRRTSLYLEQISRRVSIAKDLVECFHWHSANVRRRSMEKSSKDRTRTKSQEDHLRSNWAKEEGSTHRTHSSQNQFVPKRTNLLANSTHRATMLSNQHRTPDLKKNNSLFFLIEIEIETGKRLPPIEKRTEEKTKISRMIIDIFQLVCLVHSLVRFFFFFFSLSSDKEKEREREKNNCVNQSDLRSWKRVDLQL